VEGAAIAQLAGNLLSEWAETHEKTGENRQYRKLRPLKVMDQGAHSDMLSFDPGPRLAFAVN
jgi:hypothetical protein